MDVKRSVEVAFLVAIWHNSSIVSLITASLRFCCPNHLYVRQLSKLYLVDRVLILLRFPELPIYSINDFIDYHVLINLNFQVDIFAARFSTKIFLFLVLR